MNKQYILEGSANKLKKIKIYSVWKNNKSIILMFSLRTNSIGTSNKWVI